MTVTDYNVDKRGRLSTQEIFNKRDRRATELSWRSCSGTFLNSSSSSSFSVDELPRFVPLLFFFSLYHSHVCVF